jgi:hypothetical protein
MQYFCPYLLIVNYRRRPPAGFIILSGFRRAEISFAFFVQIIITLELKI